MRRKSRAVDLVPIVMMNDVPLCAGKDAKSDRLWSGVYKLVIRIIVTTDDRACGL